jgi:hypothetical protein
MIINCDRTVFTIINYDCKTFMIQAFAFIISKGERKKSFLHSLSFLIIICLNQERHLLNIFTNKNNFISEEIFTIDFVITIHNRESYSNEIKRIIKYAKFNERGVTRLEVTVDNEIKS